RELTTASGRRTQITDVAEHLAERHVRLDAHIGGAGLLALDHATTAVQVADHVAYVGVRYEHVHLHDWLEQLGRTLGGRLTVSGLGCNLERDLRRVDRVETTVRQGDLYMQQREANERTLVEHGLEALLDSRDELLG